MLNAPALHPSIRDVEARIADPDFPCVGAKAAATQHYLGYLLAVDLRRADDDTAIVDVVTGLTARSAGQSNNVACTSIHYEVLDAG